MPAMSGPVSSGAPRELMRKDGIGLSTADFGTIVGRAIIGSSPSQLGFLSSGGGGGGRQNRMCISIYMCLNNTVTRRVLIYIYFKI